MSIRVYQLAKDLGLDNKQVMALLRDRGLKVISASSSIPNIYADALAEELKITPASKATPEPTTIRVPLDDAPEPSAAPAVPKIEVVPARKPASVPAVPKVQGQGDAAEIQSVRRPSKPFIERSEGANSRSEPHPAGGNAIKIPLPKLGAKKPVSFTSRTETLGLESPSERAKPSRPPEVILPGRKKNTEKFTDKRSAPTVHFELPSRKQRPLENKIPIQRTEKTEESVQELKTLVCKAPIIVRDFAQKIGIKPFQLISILMRQGIFASMNQQIADEIAIDIAQKYGYLLEVRQKSDLNRPAPQKPKVVIPKEILPRPPVVCVLGHVDHGKTTLLDFIRHTSVVAGEAGGITQHTGAYQVECDGKKITFLDTPGHAAFSSMRERGVEVTDIAILVVAADDGFMPQTDEALKFAQKAGVPVVVAINKIDAKGANLDHVKQQMQQRGIAPEEWGGDTLCVGISALKGTNIDELLSLVLLQAEMMELKADYKCPAVGVVIESQIDTGRGPVATVIIREGTLKVGDALVCGSKYCRVRSMLNERAEVVKAATPSTPVKIIGWSGVPENGAVFETVKDEKTAKNQAEEYAINEKRSHAEPVPKIANMKSLFEAIESQKQKVLKVVVKCDVQGTLEALIQCLEAIKSDRVKLEILDSGVGAVSQSDVEFASSSGALIVGFNVKKDNGVAPLAKNKGVRILLHDIIYELIDQVKEAMSELLDYEYTEEHLGTAEVRQVFELAKGTVAGCMVIDGQIARDKPIRVRRNNEVLFEGKIDSLKRQKEDQSEVRSGFECGIKVEGFSDFETGDTLESYDRIRHLQKL
ncbi:MAG: translation initiation factor IF-2 [Verrucomicrobiota bacterium]|nr:MAG: translation initiation factor IF-2 [Verrucomicrobiota bacterium]